MKNTSLGCVHGCSNTVVAPVNELRSKPMKAIEKAKQEVDFTGSTNELKVVAVDPRDCGIIARGLMYNKV